MDWDKLSKSQLTNLIDEWIIGKNAERDREILKRRLIDGISFERLGEEFDLTPKQIMNIVYKREEHLFAHI